VRCCIIAYDSDSSLHIQWPLAPHGDQTRDVKPTLETAVYGSNSGPWNMVDVLAWFWFAEAQAD
jgi:hypothetical protein